MRPLELRLEGFRSYDRPVVFDWRERQLVGIVGPIGSGKTSILDAIAFALYGKTPVFERESRTLIHQAADHLRVRLDFEVDGEAWRALRVVRAKGAGQHALYCLSGADGGAVPEAEREREMTARVERLLGLDFAAFNRSVLLAQNRFAQFLHASPGERDKVLKGVFGFDRIDAMHALARGRRAEAETAAAGLAGRLEGLDADRQRLDAARDAAEQAEQAVARFDRAAADVERRQRQEQEAVHRLERADERLAAVRAVAAQKPEAAAVRARAERTAASRADLEGSERALAEARAAVADAEAERQALADAAGTAADLARAEQALRALERTRARLGEEKKSRTAAGKAIAEAEAEAAGAVEALERARRDEIAAGGALAAAGEARAAAEQDLRAAELAHMAATVARSATVGAPCPVCGRTVEQPPVEAEARPLDQAEARVAAARETETESRRDHRRASRAAAKAEQEAAHADAERARARARYEETTERLRKAEQEAATLTVELTDRLGLGDPAEQLARLDARVEGADAAVERARAAAAEAAERREARRGEVEEARAAADRLSHRLAHLAGSLGAEVDEAVDLATLERRLDRAVRDSEAAAEAERAAAEAERREARAGRRALLAELGLEVADDEAGGDDFPAARERVRRRAAEQRAEAERLERAAADAEQVSAELERARARLRHLRQLSDDLTAPRFLRYLLDEERAGLAELGSERFEMLSGGRYRFADDGTFAVVDLANAEAVRKAETLSGGETFLASLALALALAETVTASGGRLDAFFLDEGFGALDEEHLELAMDGIERLVADSPERLVCVVSHVAALTERVDDLIVLDKDSLTGASRVLSGGRHLDVDAAADDGGSA